MSPRAAVIGAGVVGLVAAHDLVERGWRVDVLERWPGLGGQAATFDAGEGVLLERYYHHWFTSDAHIIELCRRLGVEVEWHPSSVAFFTGGRSHPFVSPLDLLRFSPLPVLSRIRMGLAVLELKLRHKRVDALQDKTAHEWIVSRMGRPAWDQVWGPLLRGKFGSRAEDIAMAWLWARLTLRRQVKGSEAAGETLGYPSGTFEQLFVRLRERIEAGGGRVLIDRPAARIDARQGRFVLSTGASGSFRRGHDPRAFDAEGEEVYDAVLATVPNRIFEALLGGSLAAELTPGYLDRLRSIEYHAALCLVLELDRRFSEYYWTNIGEPDLPFIGLVEQTNFIASERYRGRRFLYVANYVEAGDPLLELGPDELIAAYEPGLRRVNPDFDRSWIKQRWLYREPDAQPIVTPGYPRRMPPLETGVPGLVLANTSQIYPEDRGTNYAVRMGHEAADRLTRAVPAAVDAPGVRG